MTMSYEDRLRRVLRHIHDNPAGDLSLDTLADVAAMSRFHWHRVFHAMTGETCAQAVRRVRAHRASFWLVQTDESVARIARRAGYDNVQSFNRAFRDVFGVTPTSFRKSGVPGAAPLFLTMGDTDMYDITIEDRPALRIAALEHRGAYTKIGRAFEEVSAVFSDKALWPQARGLVAVYFDDPSATPEDRLQSVAGVSVDDDFALPDGLHEVRLTAGRTAVLRLKGPYSGLADAYEHLYGHWLPSSGEEPADRPPFEVYLNTPQDTAPADLLTEICAPLKAR